MTEDLAPYADAGTNPNQGDEAWRQERAGCITASCMSDLDWDPDEVYKTGDKKGQHKPQSLARLKYIDQIVAEILTGKPREEIRAKALDHGKELEPEAVVRYEERVGRLVEQCGFIRHPQYNFIGASPDFLVDDDGGGEIKCPMSMVVHATTLREGLPKEHIEQIQGGLWVTGRLWWDFVSYHPDFPPGLDLYVQRVERDPLVIARIKRNCLSAWDQVQQILDDLQHRRAA